MILDMIVHVAAFLAGITVMAVTLNFAGVRVIESMRSKDGPRWRDSCWSFLWYTGTVIGVELIQFSMRWLGT